MSDSVLNSLKKVCKYHRSKGYYIANDKGEFYLPDRAGRQVRINRRMQLLPALFPLPDSGLELRKTGTPVILEGPGECVASGPS